MYYFTVAAGKIARLKCELVNSTGVTFRWYRNKSIIRNSKGLGKYRIKRGTNDLLKIIKTEPSDAGKYVCVAKNKFGTIRRTLNLTVIGEYFLFILVI